MSFMNNAYFNILSIMPVAEKYVKHLRKLFHQRFSSMLKKYVHIYLRGRIFSRNINFYKEYNLVEIPV
jgi:uncharacterized pyridoxamine 5'-phosphate oxidase family protein